MFHIVEFTDGMSVVPDNWLLDNASCFYPSSVKSQILFNKMVMDKSQPDDSWELHGVLKVYGNAESYTEAIQKLKLYQKFSDVESGSEQRKLLTRKRVESSSEDENSQSLLSSLCKKQTLNGHHSQYVSDSLPIVPAKMQSNQKFDCSLSSSFFDTSSPQVPVISENPSVSQVERHKSECKCGLRSQVEANGKILQELLKKDNYIIGKLSALEKMMKSKEDIFGGNVDVTHYKEFPFGDLRQLKEFDAFLVADEQNYKNLVKYFRGIGGNSSCHVVANILKRVVKDNLAEMFSWAGVKKKMPFKVLNLTKAVIETTRLAFPVTTEEEVRTLIANWLRHARQRRERAEGVAAKVAE